MVLVATACNPTESPAARSARVWSTDVCQVGVVGDSLTVGARDLGGLQARFEQADCTVAIIDARTNRPTREGADIVERWADVGVLPRILVVALGTNDCNGPSFSTQVDRILAAAGPRRPVVWVNTWRDGCDAAINAVLDRERTELADARDDGGNLWILDHHGWVDSNPAVLSRDGVHLTGTGYRSHAARIVTMVTTGAEG